MTERELHYPGDCTAGLVGRVMGPTRLGQLLTVIAADYDPVSDRTTAHLRPSTQPEVDAARGVAS
jgi:hypothetical protein